MNAEKVDWDAIYEKLLKLKNLAENPGTIGEAEAAATALQRMMFSYNIKMSDLQKHMRKDKITMGKFFFSLGAKTKWLLEWKQDLVQFVAQYNFCRAFRFNGASTVCIIGSEQNASVVRELSFFLIEAIRHGCNEAWNKHGFGYPEVKWRKSYYYGAVSKIAERLEADFFAMKNEHGEIGSALVIQNKEELDEAVKHHFERVEIGESTDFKPIDTAASLGFHESGKINYKGKKLKK